MGRRTRTFGAIAGFAAFTALSLAGPASAAAIQIRAIFEGPSGGGFVELQMTADGQNHVAGQKLCVYPNSGILCSAFPLPGDVANGGNQRTILIGDNAALSPDLNTGGALHTSLAGLSAGAVCFGNLDCASWGAFTNGANLPSPAGTPLSGLSTSQVAIRRIDRGCPTALDSADDTNDSFSDFTFGVGFPVRNNAAAPTETPCPSSTTTTPKKKCKKRKRIASGGSAYAAKKRKCKKRH